MKNNLVRTLFRRSLRVATIAERANATHIVKDRWAEFIPRKVLVQKSDHLPQIVRRCFEAPLTSNSHSQGFAFLREAMGSLLTIELLSSWEQIAQEEDFDLCHSLALISAASELAEKEAYQLGSLSVLVSKYAQFFQKHVAQAQERITSDLEREGISVQSVKEAILRIHEDQKFERREVQPEDFTLRHLLKEGKASEYILNIFLSLVFAGRAEECTLVGVDLVFRWLRLSTTKRQNLIFATWSYGAFERKNMERFIKTADSQWFKKQENTLQNRKNVVCSLLRRQLSLLATSELPSKDRQLAICKEQILFLLAV